MDPLLSLLLALVVLALFLLWLVFFPERRDRIWRSLCGSGRIAGGRLGSSSRQVGSVLGQQSRMAGQGMRRWYGLLRRHGIMIVLVAVALLAPAALVLSTRDHVMLQGYTASQAVDSDTAQLVASLLRGEQLAPPAALPPAVFEAPEVQMQVPQLHLGRANRNWDLLDPDFRQRLLVVFKIMQERYGYHMVMIEGYRSPRRQRALASQSNRVTNAGPGQSYHQYGLAADCAFYRDGKLVISNTTSWTRRGYTLYGEVARDAGLVWGGSWKSILDLGHVELHAAGKGPGSNG